MTRSRRPTGIRWGAGVLAAVVLGVAGCSGAPDQPPPSTAPSPAASPLAPLPSIPADSRPVQPAPDVRPEGFADPPPGRGLARYESQRAGWQACGSLRCATVLVPLDYADPDGTAITLTVGLRPAKGTARTTVVTNPGGPGGSGLAFVRGVSDPAFDDVDLIGWDPRGVGRSTPVSCSETAVAELAELDESPDDATERTALVAGSQRFGLSCLERSGALLGHLSSAESARDLDLIRSALGLPRISYVGLSNGTLIGAIYAQLFPDRVDRFVLDGAVDISRSSTTQLQGFDRALTAMADWCVARGAQCPLGRTPSAVIDAVAGLWTRLEDQPLAAGGRTLTQSLAATGVLAALYGGSDEYPALVRSLATAIDQGQPGPLLALADRLNGRQTDGRWDQFAYAYPASRCADAGNRGLATAWRQARTEARQAPLFGPVLGTDVECAVWPVDAPKAIGELTAPKAPPLLVIGTTGDPATPYEWAQGMAGQLRSATLVTHDGTTHTAFGSGCYAAVVGPYLLDVQLPARGTRC